MEDEMKKYSKEQRKELLEQKKTSGLSVSAFCKEKNIKDNTFNYWRKRERQKEKPVGFIQVPRKLYGETKSTAEYTISIGAMKVQVPANTAISEIKALVDIIWKLSC